MLLEVEEEVFDSSDHAPVTVLLDLIANERHEWRPSLPVVDAAERFVTENTPNARSLKEFVHKSLVEAANPAPSAGTPVRIYSARLRQLVHDLQRAAVFVVEDGINEECFLLAVARAFGRQRILVAMENKWLEFANAGGKYRMPAYAAQHRDAFHLLGTLRVAALLDSDRPVPDRRTDSHELAEQVEAQGCAVYVWQRRHLESYLPTVVLLRQFPTRAGKIGMLLDMRPDQRGCLHMKKGLQPRELEDPQVAAHFGDLSPEVRQQWSTGLPARTPVVPEDLPLTEADFAELGPEAVAELRQVLAMIEQIL